MEILIDTFQVLVNLVFLLRFLQNWFTKWHWNAWDVRMNRCLSAKKLNSKDYDYEIIYLFLRLMEEKFFKEYNVNSNTPIVKAMQQLIETIQRALRFLNFLPPNMSIDGTYSCTTMEAVQVRTLYSNISLINQFNRTFNLNITKWHQR